MDTFAKFRWMLDEFEDNARRLFKYTELDCLSEILNFFSRVGCDWLVVIKGKPVQIAYKTNIWI